MERKSWIYADIRSVSFTYCMHFDKISPKALPSIIVQIWPIISLDSKRSWKISSFFFQNRITWNNRSYIAEVLCSVFFNILIRLFWSVLYSRSRSRIWMAPDFFLNLRYECIQQQLDLIRCTGVNLKIKMRKSHVFQSDF